MGIQGGAMISVCMATYNGGKYVKQQIISILEQLGETDELIISDDSSTDLTVSIIEKIIDKRIKLFTNNNFSSPTLNFENALKYSSGEYIFLSDQDDVWLENKVKIMMEYLKEYDLVVSDSYITDEELHIMSNSAFKIFKSKNGILKNIYKNTYYGCCMAFTRKTLEKSIPFPRSREIGHDLWLGLIGEIIGKVIFIDEKLIYFRRHSQTVTMGGRGKSKRSILKKLYGRILILAYLMNFYFKLKVMG